MPTRMSTGSARAAGSGRAGGSGSAAGAGGGAGDPVDLRSRASESPGAVADLRLALPALVGWADVAIGLGQPWEVLTAIAVSQAVLCAVIFRLVNRRGRAAAGVFLLTAVVGALMLGALSAAQGLRTVGPVGDLAQQRAMVDVLASVDSEPRVLTGQDRGGRPIVLVSLSVTEVTGRGSRATVATPVLLVGDPRWADVRWRAVVRVVGRLSPAEPAERSVAVLRAMGPPQVVSEPGLMFGVADHVRERLRAATAGLPADARGLVPGLVLGDTSQTPPELTAAMLDTGLTHLSAVSGSNVAIVVAAVVGFTRLVGLRRRGRPVLAVLVLGAFVVLVRPEPSVLRAAAMGLVGLAGMSVDRRRAGLPALAAAVVGLLVWDPWLARSPGFALSTLASLGLLLFARPWGAALTARLPRRLAWLGPAVSVPVAAQVFCLPVIVAMQGSLSTVSVAANLLAGPLVAPATVLGVAAALVASVWSTAGAWLAWPAAIPALGISTIARVGAQLPWGSVPWPSDAVGLALLVAVVAVVLLSGPWLVRVARLRPTSAAVVVLLVGVGVVPTQSLTWPPPWQLVMCDIGQGDAIALSTGPGHAVLVDTGPDPPAVDRCLSQLHVEVLDAVVLTHFHADHVDGLSGVLTGRHVTQVLATPITDPAYEAESVSRLCAAAGVPLRTLYAGDTLALGTARLRVWWPRRRIDEGSVPNNASLVITADLGPLRALLLGDVEAEAAGEVLRALRAEGSVLAAGFDVVKVAHHGSANRDDALLAAVAAPLGLVSVGVDNDYGHPAPSTLRVLSELGYHVLRTDQSGDIAVVKGSDGVLRVRTHGR